MEKGSDFRKIFWQEANNAFQKGLEDLMNQNPIFANYIPYHLDMNKLKKKASQIYSDNTKSDEQKLKYIQEQLFSYASNGEVLDEKGKKMLISHGSLEEKAKQGFFSKLIHKKENKKTSYLEKAIEASKDLYALMSSGDYAQRMPELANAVITLYDTQFLSPAIDILKENGLWNERKYNLVKKQLEQRTTYAVEGMKNALEKYTTPQSEKAQVYKFPQQKSNYAPQESGTRYSTSAKIAAGIFIFLGVVLVLNASFRTTGYVINGLQMFNNGLGSIIGLLLFCAGIIIFVMESLKD